MNRLAVFAQYCGWLCTSRCVYAAELLLTHWQRHWFNGSTGWPFRKQVIIFAQYSAKQIYLFYVHMSINSMFVVYIQVYSMVAAALTKGTTTCRIAIQHCKGAILMPNSPGQPKEVIFSLVAVTLKREHHY